MFYLALVVAVFSQIALSENSIMPMGERAAQQRGDNRAPVSPFGEAGGVVHWGKSRGDGFRGKCLVQGSKKKVTPCPRIEVSLKDKDGVTVERTLVDVDGGFQFSAYTDTSYFLYVTDKDYVSEPLRQGPFRAGDTIRLNVKKR